MLGVTRLVWTEIQALRSLPKITYHRLMLKSVPAHLVGTAASVEVIRFLASQEFTGGVGFGLLVLTFPFLIILQIGPTLAAMSLLRRRSAATVRRDNYSVGL